MGQDGAGTRCPRQKREARRQGHRPGGIDFGPGMERDTTATMTDARPSVFAMGGGQAKRADGARGLGFSGAGPMVARYWRVPAHSSSHHPSSSILNLTSRLGACTTRSLLPFCFVEPGCCGLQRVDLPPNRRILLSDTSHRVLAFPPAASPHKRVFRYSWTECPPATQIAIDYANTDHLP